MQRALAAAQAAAEAEQVPPSGIAETAAPGAPFKCITRHLTVVINLKA